MLSHPLIMVGIGGAAGAMSRYLLVRAITPVLADGQYPFGTWLANISGSFLFGLLFVIISERFNMSDPLRFSMLVGFLGAFTTFSSFSFETVRLLETGHIITALIYILSSVTLCLLATWGGMRLGEFII